MMVPVAAHTSRTIIGRDSELAQLGELVGLTGPDRPWRGRPGAVLLSGDAGVGKTRLLIELRDLANAEGWRVYAGHCLDFGESALPYLPFSEILGRLAAQQPELVDRVAAVHPAITRLQPGRRVRPAADGAPPTAEPGSTGDRAELFEAFYALLDAAASDAPMLVVVEDAHWADQSTRDLLGFLFTRSFENPVSLVASYRSDDLHRRHPLRRQVAEWSRIPSVDRLQLSRLSEPAVRRLIAELAPVDLGERQVAAIIDRAEGNAFFVEELVASECSDCMPGDLADLLLVRVDRLGDRARQVVRLASVAGRRVSHGLLQAASGMSAADVEEGTRQAVEMNVLVAGGGTYSFRHALLGEAVYDDLLPGERVRLHGQYVDALTSGAGRGTAAELAFHARRAMDLDRAAAASVEAGDEARSVGGPDEAAHHYEQALELLADADRAARLEIDVSKLAVKAADALTASGSNQRAAELLAEHLERLPADASPNDRARLLSEYAMTLCLIETQLDPAALSEEAVALVPMGESPLRAKVLAAHARVLVNYDRLDDAETAATEALALAERLNMPAVAFEAVTTLTSMRIRHGGGDDREELRAALEDAVQRAMTAGAIAAELRGRFLLGRSYQDDAEWEEAARWFASGLERGLAVGLPWAPYSLEARWQLAWVEYLRGNWDSALELVAVVDDDSGPILPRAVIEPVRLAIAVERGADVSADLARLRKAWIDEGGIAVFAAGTEIEAAGVAGDPEAALAAYDDVVAVLSAIWHEHFHGRVRLAAQTLAALARTAHTSASIDRPALLERGDRLAADAAAVVESHLGTWGPEGLAWQHRVTAEHLRLRWLAGIDPPDRQELLDAWAAALAAYETFGNVPELAKVRATYAGILRLVGENATAREHGDAAREVAHRLGMTTVLDDLRAAGSAPARASGGAPTQLTAREREILALVAEGRSNGEIGRQLFISTKTVSVHVSNILGKLGASGRTEAAAIARRDGLLA
jgi:DNA-binding NarL/FixJ family response regulator